MVRGIPAAPALLRDAARTAALLGCLALAALPAASAEAPAPGGSTAPPTAAAIPAGGGIRWLDLSVDAAIAEAAKSGKPVLLDVWATWCGPCKRQTADVWSKTEGGKLGAASIPIHVDFDTEEGQRIKRRYNVIGLPSVIVLDGRGSEIDRLVGYDNSEEWLGALRPIVAGTDPLPELRKRLVSDPDSAPLHLELGKKLLNRGDEAGALREFLGVLARDREGQGAEVAFVLGRYYQRVREMPAEALPHWKNIAASWPGTPYLTGAVAWALDAYQSLGRSDEGIAWAGKISATRPEDGELHYVIASWAKENGVKSAAALEHAKKAKALGVDAPDLDAVLAYLGAGS